LFGAGAVIPWGAPSTKCLTDLLIKDSASSFICNDNQTKVIQFIVDTLITKESEINFETIIDVVEEFIVHYSYIQRKKKHSKSKIFFDSKFENILSNFSIAGGEEKHGYHLEIPKGKEYPFSKIAIDNQSPPQFYFQHLLSELLTTIVSQISHYSYHSKGNSKIDASENAKRNKWFQDWYSIISKDACVRMYTLNYDRLYKVLVEKIGISVFEGFESGEFIPEKHTLPNIKRILTDFDSPVYYNLHVSSFWEVHSRDERGLKHLTITLRPYPILDMNKDENYTTEIDKERNVVVSNIITGYQKAQKSFLSPFRQMQSAFDKDCILCNDLIVIGYSFGDSHINSSIVTALISNPKLKLHFIDPAYSGDEGYNLLVNRLIFIFNSIINKSELGDPVYSLDKNSCSYFDGKLTVTSVGFEEYLSKL